MAKLFQFLGRILRMLLGSPNPDPTVPPVAPPAAPPLSQPTPGEPEIPGPMPVPPPVPSPPSLDRVPPSPPIPDELIGIDVPGLPPEETGRQWTMMIFMAGDNGLKFETEAGWTQVMAEMTSAGYTDIVELRTAGTSDQVACVVQFDTVSENDRSYRIIINPPGQAPTVQTIPETNTGDPATLTDFIVWGQQTFPAQHYAVVIWNHGGGWKEDDLWERYRDVLPVATRSADMRSTDMRAPLAKNKARKSLFLSTTDRIMALPDAPPPASTRSTVDVAPSVPTRGLSDNRQIRGGLRDGGSDIPSADPVVDSDTPLLDRIMRDGSLIEPEAPSTRWIAADDSSKDFLDNAELQAAFQQAAMQTGETVDIIGMDACLMAMAEVAFQLRHNAAFMVASQEVEPMAGWDYTRLLRTMVSQPDLRPEQVAEAMVDLYMASYAQENRRGITQSATILAQMDTLSGLLGRFVATVEKAWASSEAVRTGLRRAQINALRFEDPDYRDLVDFLRLVVWEMSSLPSPAEDDADANVVDADDIRRAAEEVLKVIDDTRRTPILAHGVAGVQYQQSGTGAYRAHGLTIYLPEQHISQFYDGLDFRASRWGNLIRLLNGIAG